MKLKIIYRILYIILIIPVTVLALPVYATTIAFEFIRFGEVDKYRRNFFDKFADWTNKLVK